MLENLEATALHTQIRDQITRFIQIEGLKVGDRLPSETQLVKSLGVSRNAVREALRGLEASGMVEARQGKGRFLRSFDFGTLTDNLAFSFVIDKASMRELMEIRCALELNFLPHAISTLRSGDIEALRDTVARMRAKTQGGETHMEEEVEFHVTLFKHVNNSLLHRLFKIFWELLQKVTDEGVIPPPESPDIVEYHAQIVDAIASGDQEKAHQVLRDHFGDLRYRTEIMSLNR